MKLLLLGGTAFLGRAIARHAVAADLAVTCLARGTQSSPEGVTFVVADRDAEDALTSVATTTWDAVVDLTSTPGHARRAASQLRTRHWLFVSSSSVYLPFTVADQDESSPILEPLQADAIADMSQYGAAKVACEEVFVATGVPTTVLRPGLIGGDGDVTGRSGYYPWRFAHPTGEDVLVPDGTQLISVLDVEDLAAWVVHCLTQRLTGTFNVAGETLPLGRILAHCQELTGSTARIRAVPDEVLLGHSIQPWMGPRSLPLWIPIPELRFIATLGTDLARGHGFTPRPLVETLTAALRYEKERDLPRQAGLTDDEEIELRGQLAASS